MIIFSTHSRGIQNAKLTNDLAPEIEAGTDIMVQRIWACSLEVKKAWLTTHATGNPVAPAWLPFSGKVGYAPWVYSTGVTFHF